MILAVNIPSNLIFLIVFAAVGVVNWWLERKKKQSGSDEQQSPPRPQPRAGGPAPGGESEQERLRRFLEALGVPQQPGQTQPRPVRQITPAPAPRAITKPVEPARRAHIPEPRRISPAPRPAEPQRPQPRKRPPIHEVEQMQRAGRLEEPASSIEGVSSEFQHMTMEQLGVPAHLAETPATPATLVRNAAEPVIESLRLALRTRTDLRTAFVTMELLGKPRGLQS